MKRFGALAALLAVVLVTGACGRSSSDGNGTPAGGTTTTAAGGSAEGPGDFGTLKDVCGPGENTQSPDQGVTPTAINVATSSDPGFAGRRGLNQEIFDAGEVFTKWCNDAGGINGRKIVLHEYDAALFNFDAQVKKACDADFFLVGNGNVFDDQGQKTRLSCLLPEIPTYMVTIQARDSDLTVQPVPNKTTEYAVAPFNYVAQKYPDATKSVVSMTGNISATLLVDEQAREAAEKLGWTLKGGTILYNPAAEATWLPFAQQIKDKGAKGLIYTGEPQNFALLAKALKQINYNLDFVIVAANHYDQNLINDGGSAIHNVYMVVGFVPFEDASENPATQQYLDLFEKYKPSGKSHAALGPQAFSARLLFAEAAKACGDNLTRRCVYDNSLKQADWTGGGLSAPQDVPDQKVGICGIVLEASSSGFAPPDGWEPNSGKFNCDPKNAVELTDDYSKYGVGVKLSDVGKTLDDLK